MQKKHNYSCFETQHYFESEKRILPQSYIRICDRAMKTLLIIRAAAPKTKNEELNTRSEPHRRLSQLSDGTDGRRTLVQDEDQLGNGPHVFSGFPRLCSGMFSELFRMCPDVGARKIRLL